MTSTVVIASERSSRNAAAVFGKSYPRDEWTSFLARYPGGFFITCFVAFLFTIIALASQDPAAPILNPDRLSPVNTLASKLYRQARRADADWDATRNLLDPVAATAATSPPSFNGNAVARLTLIFYFDEVAATNAHVIPQELSFFRPNPLAFVKEIEDFVVRIPQFSRACWRTNLFRGQFRVDSECAPPNSITQYFYPGSASVADPVSGNRYYPMDGSSSSRAQENIEGMIDRIFLNPRWRWYFDKEFTNSNSSSNNNKDDQSSSSSSASVNRTHFPKAIKSQFILGASSPWKSGELDPTNADNIDEFLIAAYDGLLLEAGRHPYIKILFHSERLEQALVEREVGSGITWRVIVCVVIIIILLKMKNKSLFLAIFSTAQIWFTYSLMQSTAYSFNNSGESVIAILFLFAVLSLSLNSILIYIDTFNHSGVMITTGGTNTLSVEQRISWTFRKVLKGAFVSHLVVIIIGIILLKLSPVPAISDAGAISIIAALFDLLFFFTYTPSMILFHHFYFSKRRRLLQRRRDMVSRRGANVRDIAVSSILDAIQISRDLKGEKPPQQPLMVLGSSGATFKRSTKISASGNPDDQMNNQSSFFNVALQIKRAYKSLRNEIRSLSRAPNTNVTTTAPAEKIERIAKIKDRQKKKQERDKNINDSIRSRSASPTNNNNNNQTTTTSGRTSRTNSPMMGQHSRSGGDDVNNNWKAINPMNIEGGAFPIPANSSSSLVDDQQQQQQERSPSPPGAAIIKKKRRQEGNDNDDDDDNQKEEFSDAEGGSSSENSPSERPMEDIIEEDDLENSNQNNHAKRKKEEARKRLIEEAAGVRGMADDDDEEEGDDNQDDEEGEGEEKAQRNRRRNSSSEGAGNLEDVNEEEAILEQSHSEMKRKLQQEEKEKQRRARRAEIQDGEDLSKSGIVEATPPRRRILNILEKDRKDHENDDDDDDTTNASPQPRHTPGQSIRLPAVVTTVTSSSANNHHQNKRKLHPMAAALSAASEQAQQQEQQVGDDQTEINRRHSFTNQKNARNNKQTRRNSDAFGFSMSAIMSDEDDRNDEDDEEGNDETSKEEAFLDAFADAPVASSALLSSRLVPKRKLLHIPPSLCFRNEHAREHIVRMLNPQAVNGVVESDEFSGLDPSIVPLTLPSLPALSSIIVAPAEETRDYGDENGANNNNNPSSSSIPNNNDDEQTRRDEAVRTTVISACEEAGEFVKQWEDASKKMGIVTVTNNKLGADEAKDDDVENTTAMMNNNNNNNANHQKKITIPAAQRALTAFFIAQQHCFQPGGASSTEYIFNAPAHIPAVMISQQEERNRLARAQQQQQQQQSNNTIIGDGSNNNNMTGDITDSNQQQQLSPQDDNHGGFSIAPMSQNDVDDADDKNNIKIDNYGTSCCSQCINAIETCAATFNHRVAGEDGIRRKYWLCGPRLDESQAQRDARLLKKSSHVEIKQGLLEEYIGRFFNDFIVIARFPLLVIFIVLFILSIVGVSLVTGSDSTFQTLENFNYNEEFRSFARTRMWQDEVITCDTCGPYFRDSNEAFPLTPSLVSACDGTSDTAELNLYLDKCGVCLGNNSCVDCAGVANGGASIDRCGNCLSASDPTRNNCTTSSSSQRNCTGNPILCTFCEEQYGPAFRNFGGANCDVLCDETTCKNGKCNRLTAKCECFFSQETGYFAGDDCTRCVSAPGLFSIETPEFSPQPGRSPGDVWGSCYFKCDPLSAVRPSTRLTDDLCRSDAGCPSLAFTGASCKTDRKDICVNPGFYSFTPQKTSDDVVEGASRYQCVICPPGYGGDRCAYRTECNFRGIIETSNSNNLSLSLPSDKRGFCECEGMWTGRNCQLCACRNGGLCINPEGTCRCLGTWAGHDCSICAGSCTENGGTCPPAYEPKHYPTVSSCAAIFCTQLELLRDGTCAACSGVVYEAYTNRSVCTCDVNGPWKGNACDTCFAEGVKCLSNGNFVGCDGNIYSSRNTVPVKGLCGDCRFPGINPDFDLYDKCDSREPAYGGINDVTDIFLYIGLYHPLGDSNLASSEFTSRPQPLSAIRNIDDVVSDDKDGGALPLYDLGFNFNSSAQQYTVSVLCDRLQDHETGDSVWSYLDSCPDREFLWYAAIQSGASNRIPAQYNVGIPPSQTNAIGNHSLQYLRNSPANFNGDEMAVQLSNFQRLDRTSSEPTTVERVSFFKYRLTPGKEMFERDKNAGENVRHFEVLRKSIESVMSVPALFASQWWVEQSFKNQAPLTLYWVISIGFISVGILTNILQRSFVAALLLVLCISGACLSTFAILVADGVTIGTVELLMLPAIFAITCAHSIHVIEAYAEVLQASQSNLFAQELSRRRATKEAIARSGPALLTSSVTILLICAVFSTSKLIPLSRAAQFSALAVFCSVVFSVIFLPALLAIGGPETYYSPWMSLVLSAVWSIVVAAVLLIIAGTGGVQFPDGSIGLSL